MWLLCIFLFPNNIYMPIYFDTTLSTQFTCQCIAKLIRKSNWWQCSIIILMKIRFSREISSFCYERLTCMWIWKYWNECYEIIYQVKRNHMQLVWYRLNHMIIICTYIILIIIMVNVLQLFTYSQNNTLYINKTQLETFKYIYTYFHVVKTSN